MMGYLQGYEPIHYKNWETGRMHDVAIHMVHHECWRQYEKWLDQTGHSNEKWMTILMEEVGELAKEILEGKHPQELIKELTQVAAVGVSWLDSIFCNDKKSKELEKIRKVKN